MLSITLPFRLVNSLNERVHWAVKARRAREQRNVTRMALTSQHGWTPDAYRLPCVVSLTRISPRPFDGHDGLPASCKNVADGIVDAMGLDSDRQDGLTFVYAWRKGAKAEHKVEIVVESFATACPGEVSSGSYQPRRQPLTPAQARATLGSFKTS